ncbi:MAG: hypothetical protein QXK34_03755 [Candidatus Bathyarchaeia archaeon]
MPGEIKYVQLKSLEDLVKIVVASPMSFIQHYFDGSAHFYFINVLFAGGGTLIYFFKAKEGVDKKYIIFDPIRGRILFSDSISTDANARTIPLIDVERQNVIPEGL